MNGRVESVTLKRTTTARNVRQLHVSRGGRGEIDADEPNILQFPSDNYHHFRQAMHQPSPQPHLSPKSLTIQKGARFRCQNRFKCIRDESEDRIMSQDVELATRDAPEHKTAAAACVYHVEKAAVEGGQANGP